MDNNSKFFEAMKLVTALPTDMQERFISEVKEQQRHSIVDKLRVGSIVKINHKKINPLDKFQVTKINRKNIKVQKVDSLDSFIVAPSFLEVIR